MNKILSTAIIAAGLLLLHAPEAEAGHRTHNYQRSAVYDHYGSRHNRHNFYRSDYRPDYRRARRIPHWLHHNRSFRHWYEHSRMRRDRGLSWQRLYKIYRWEHSHNTYRRY